MKVYDISAKIWNRMPVWPGDPPTEVTLTSHIEHGDRCNVSRITMGSHAGTHLDAPFHFLEHGKTLDKVDLDVFIGPARVFHLPNVKRITREMVERLDLPGPGRILFRTSNSGAVQAGPFKKDYSFITPEAALCLAESKVILVGVDYLSIEQYDSLDNTAHKTLLSSGAVLLEGLDLSRVPAGDYLLMALPLKIENADGSPTRAVLIEGEITH